MNVELCPVYMTDAIWPKIAAGVEQSVARCDSDLSVAYLWQICRGGTGFLIVAHDGTEIRAFAIHRFEQYRSGWKLCCLVAWGPGLLREVYAEMKAAAETVARSGGANGLISEGSDAYLRMIPGAKKVRTLFEVPIDGEN